MAIKKIAYYLSLLQQAHEQNNFHALEIIDNEATVAYGYMNSKYGRLEAEKAIFIDNYKKENEDIKHTNASLDNQWDITEKGQEMLILKRDIGTMEAILRSVKNKLIVLSIEKKETNN
jgi:hypothetical protein